MASDLDTIWARDEEQAAGPQPLSRETIIAAAIEIADTEGLEAVSIRRLATKLEARPMSLYSHIEKKGDLIDLMVDEVMGGAILPDGLPEDWRQALRQIAQRTRESTRAHPWMSPPPSADPSSAPTPSATSTSPLSAVSSLPLTPERKRAVLLAVDTYTLGFVRWEVISKSRHEGARPRRDCAAIPYDSPSAADIDAYIATQVATGKYPHLAEFARQEEDEPRRQSRGFRGRPRLAPRRASRPRSAPRASPPRPPVAVPTLRNGRPASGSLRSAR